MNFAPFRILKTTAALADWQDTYGRLEIWEIDDNGLKWLQWSFQFQWESRTCYFNNTETGDAELCDLLPLTDSDDYGVYFEWTMPHRLTDTRKAPLVAVWYDLLSIPYAVRPRTDFNYTNFTWDYIETTSGFGWTELWSSFNEAIIAALVLFGCFVAVITLSAFVAPDGKKKKDFMIDTRNLRSTFRHTKETLMCEPVC